MRNFGSRIVAAAIIGLLSWQADAQEHVAKKPTSSVLYERTAKRISRSSGIRLRSTLSGALIGQAQREVSGGEPNFGFRGTVAATIDNSLKLRSSLHTANAASYQMKRSLVAFLPTLEGNASLSNFRNETGNEYSRPGKRKSAGLAFNMPLFAGGRNYHTLQSSRNASLAADHQFLAEEQQTAYDGIVAYLTLHMNRMSERAIRRNLHATRKIAASLTALQGAGEVGASDVAFGQAELHFLEAELEQARERTAESEIAYTSLTRRKSPKKTILPEVGALVPADIEEAVSQGIQGNSRILASEYNSRAAEHRVKATRGNYLPQLNLTAQYDFNDYQSFRVENTESWQVGVRLTVPLVNLDSVPAILQSRENASAMYYQALDTRRDVEKEIRSSWNSYQSARKRTSKLYKRVTALRRTLTGKKKEFAAGLLPISDVLERQIDLARAEIELVNSQVAYVAAAYRVGLSSNSLSFNEL